MSTKRDLVEAHGYNRRRLVTAFVSGAPGGREVEPVRYGRAVAGGVVLALLLVAGAAVSGFLQKPVAKDWAQEGLVVGSSSGSRFYAYQDKLYPVVNITSARLLLGAGKKPTFVPDELIATKDLGATIGIAGAPEVLPGTARLVQSGWSACTNGAGGVTATLARRPLVRSAGTQALRVTSGGDAYVVAGSHRYPVGEGAGGRAVLGALGLDSQAPVEVPKLWLDLFPLGDALEPPTVDGAGGHVNTGVEGLETIGTAVRAEGRHYVLDRRGRLEKLSDFAAALYGLVQDEVEVPASDAFRLVDDKQGHGPYPESWPENAVTSYASPDTPCASLHTSDDDPAVVRLAVPTSDTATENTSAVVRRVDRGSGAVVRATSAGVVDAGPLELVDGSGTAYVLGDRANQDGVRSALGYGSVRPVPVPSSWLALFVSGPQLEPRAAARPPQPASSGD